MPTYTYILLTCASSLDFSMELELSINWVPSKWVDGSSSNCFWHRGRNLFLPTFDIITTHPKFKLLFVSHSLWKIVDEIFFEGNRFQTVSTALSIGYWSVPHSLPHLWRFCDVFTRLTGCGMSFRSGHSLRSVPISFKSIPLITSGGLDSPLLIRKVTVTEHFRTEIQLINCGFGKSQLSTYNTRRY